MTDLDKQRRDYVKGLRALAGLLEKHANMRLPFDGTVLPITVYVDDAPALATAQAVMATMAAETVEVEKNKDLVVEGRVHGVRVRLRLPAEGLCEKRVVDVHKASDGSLHEIVEWDIPAELRGGDA